MILCWECKQKKPSGDFYPGSGLKNKHCKECTRKRSSAYKKANTDKVNRSNSRHRYWKNFGITLEAYEEMLEGQGGLCAICGGTTPQKKRLAIDHDHCTGEIRGLLCLNCNTKLGWFETLGDKILEYLSNPPSVKQPGVILSA